MTKLAGALPGGDANGLIAIAPRPCRGRSLSACSPRARRRRGFLPFDLEEDLKAAFGRIDPDTGEILGD